MVFTASQAEGGYLSGTGKYVPANVLSRVQPRMQEPSALICRSPFVARYLA
jgi:hypothetical protein